MTTPKGLRVIPVSDRAWLVPALGDALAGGAPILPIADTAMAGDKTAGAGSGPDAAFGFVAELQRTELPEGTAVVIRTSGSSGIPKAVALSAAALRASAEATHARLGGPGQWLVALPAQLISGLQMLVRSVVAGSQPVFFDGRFDPAELLVKAEEMDAERRYVSLVPVQFTRLLDLAERDEDAADALRRFDAVLVGGQAVTLEMRRRAHDLGVALKRSYGMSETAGGCVYDGVELGDTLVRIRGGEVQLSGPTLAIGYVGDPALTNESFVTERTGERWYRTGDAGELLGGMLTVTGRLDRVIISGGINVSLDEVERVVRVLPGWGDAVALGVPDRDWGERVHLVRASAPDGAARDRGAGSAGSGVGTEVGAGDGTVSFMAVGESLRAALSVAAVPVGESLVDAIPRLAGEKPDLVVLAALCGLGAETIDDATQELHPDHTKEQA